MAITLNEVNKVAQDFLRKEFNMELNVPIKINGRLTRSLGRMVFKQKRVTGEVFDVKIDLAKRMFYNDKNKDAIIDVLKHELVHYALFTKGEPYRDGNPHFESTLKRLGVKSTLQYEQCDTTYLLSECRESKIKEEHEDTIQELREKFGKLLLPNN